MEATEYSAKELSHQGSKGVKLELNDRFSFSGRMVRKHKSSSPLNFATSVEDYEMHGPPSKKPKTPRDPMSHRIIEKRRRDRMNNCLADLSRLIPANYMKQGQGRIEKTEIIEMAIRHIKHLQNVHRSIVSQGQCCAEKFYLGFKECEAETIRYFVECEGLDSKDQFCMRVISHLEAASQKFISGNGNCGEYRKEETNTDDKGSINSTIGSECESSKPQNLKAEMVPQSVPAILAPSHESINSATSKQLRNLLSHGNSGFEQVDSGNGSCVDSLSAYSSSESYVSSIPSHEDGGSHLASTEAESHYRSHSSSEGSSSSNSKDSKFTNYKFKHDITKRFSQEEKFSVDPSVSAHHERILEHDSNVYEKHIHGHEKHGLEKHGHSYEKHEKLSGKLKRKIVRSKSPSSSSDSTVYPTSEHSSNGNGGNMSSIQCRTAENDLVTTAVPLPAFVLHPQGTHYLPLTIQPSCFQNALPQLDRLQQPLVFHPISILVNFSAPGLVIQNAEAFVSSVNPSTAFSSNMCSNPGLNPMTNISSSSSCSSSSSTSRESSSSSRSSSGNHSLMNISSGSLSSSNSASSIGNSSSMNCSSGSSSNSSCGSLPPNSRVVTPPNNISGPISTMAPTSTTPVMNNIISHNNIQSNTHIPPVLLSGGASGPEHHLIVNCSLQGSSGITNTSSPIHTNNSINLSPNANLHHPAPPLLHSHQHHLHPHQTNNTTSNNTNNNNPNSNTNMNTPSSHLKMEDRNDNSSNVVSSSHCYPNL